jgi:hypothetical protein
MRLTAVVLPFSSKEESMRRHVKSCWPPLLATSLLVYVAGCAGELPTNRGSNSSATASKTERSSTSTQAGVPETEAKVEVKAVQFAGFEQAIKQLKGQVVVVDFWADY